MKNKNYIKQYLNLINQFNENNSEFIHYKAYKHVELYINRTHFLSRQNKRYKELHDLTYVKYYMHNFIKHYFIQFKQILLINPRRIFLIVHTKNAKVYKIRYYALQLQYQHDHYSLLLSTPLPCTDKYR